MAKNSPLASKNAGTTTAARAAAAQEIIDEINNLFADRKSSFDNLLKVHVNKGLEAHHVSYIKRTYRDTIWFTGMGVGNHIVIVAQPDGSSLYFPASTSKEGWTP